MTPRDAFETPRGSLRFAAAEPWRLAQCPGYLVMTTNSMRSTSFLLGVPKRLTERMSMRSQRCHWRSALRVPIPTLVEIWRGRSRCLDLLTRLAR